MEFVKANLYNILFIILFAGFLFVLVKRGFKAQANAIILGLVVRAEKRYGNGTGELKYSDVARDLYDSLPSVARTFLTAKDIDEIIQNGVTTMKRLLKGKGDTVSYEYDKIIYTDEGRLAPKEKK